MTTCAYCKYFFYSWMNLYIQNCVDMFLKKNLMLKIFFYFINF